MADYGKFLIYCFITLEGLFLIAGVIGGIYANDWDLFWKVLPFFNGLWMGAYLYNLRGKQ